MPSAAEDWWSVMRNYAPLQPYFKYFNITDAGHASVLRKMHDGWRSLLVQDDPKYPPCAISGRKSDLIPSCALEFFRREYPQVEGIKVEVSKKPETVFQPDPSVSMGLSIIPTASAEPEPISLPSIYGAQYVPDVVLRRPGEVYTSLGEVVEVSESVEYKRVKVIDSVTGIVAFDGSLTVENIKLHQDDPRYTVEFVEPEPVTVTEPEPVTVLESVVEPKPPTFCIDVYKLSNGSVTTTTETVDYTTLADYTNVQHLLVRECGKAIPSTQEVKEWYGYFEPVEPKPPTFCIDIYKLSNGSVTTTTETVDYTTLADYTNVQHLLVRECGKAIPSTQEVKEWYGYFEEEEEEEKPVGIPGKFNTNILVGLLAGGVLAVPILDDLLKTKKKRRR